MLKIGNVTITRRKSYDTIKYYLANQVLIFNDFRVPTIRQLAESLDINKSSVSRALIQLCDEDHWIEKIDRGSSRNSYYKIIADYEMCDQYKNYYRLPDRKKRKFSKMLKDASQKIEAGQKTHFPFGTKKGIKQLLEYQQKK